MHNFYGIAVLFVVTELNVSKPQGVTNYGWRKLPERRYASTLRQSQRPARSR